MESPYVNGPILHKELYNRDLWALRSMHLSGGLVVASTKGSYDRIWIRDCAQVAIGYLLIGEHDLAQSILDGIYGIYKRYEHKIDERIERGEPGDWAELLHPLYNTFGYECVGPGRPVGGWGYRQNDAIGLFLFAVGLAQKMGCPVLADEAKMRLTQKLVRYLERIPYWVPENSVWEEILVVSAPSIYSCTKGLRLISEFVPVPSALIEKGLEVGKSLGDRHSDVYEVDAANLYRYYPLGVCREPGILERIERELCRSHGVIRHHGDWYQAGTRLDNQGDDDFHGREAQWPWIKYWLGLAWLWLGNREKAMHYLYEADKLRVPPDWGITEAYTPVRGSDGQMVYVPSENTPLSWGISQALVLRYQLFLAA